MLVFFDPATGTALVYDGSIDGRQLTCRLNGEFQGVKTFLVDDETGYK